MSITTPILSVLLFIFGILGEAQTDPVPAHPMPPNIIIPSPEPKKQPKPPRPGTQVEWFDFKPLKNLSDPSWGELLTDIENHIPVEYGNTYRFEDKDTWGHESTHGIHGYLSNKFGLTEAYCFYHGNNKAAKINHPKFTIKEVAPLIPKSLRESRYNIYLIDQANKFSILNERPLYIWDEWVAYENGAAVGIELVKKGTYKPAHNNSCLGVLEFNVYSVYVAIAQKKLDPKYDNKQFLEFLAFSLERGMKIYREGYQLDTYNWDNHKYLKHLQSSDDAAEFRKFLIDTYGETWAKEVFDFK